VPQNKIICENIVSVSFTSHEITCCWCCLQYCSEKAPASNYAYFWYTIKV